VNAPIQRSLFDPLPDMTGLNRCSDLEAQRLVYGEPPKPPKQRRYRYAGTGTVCIYDHGNQRHTFCGHSLVAPDDQPTEDEADCAECLKRYGMQLAADKASPVWCAYAYLTLRDLCRKQPTVWAGDLRNACEWHPASDQAWSTPWLKAHREGLISRLPVDKKPADWDKARKHQCDVFKSLIYGQRRAA
jgi:hypothetical protein